MRMERLFGAADIELDMPLDEVDGYPLLTMLYLGVYIKDTTWLVETLVSAMLDQGLSVTEASEKFSLSRLQINEAVSYARTTRLLRK